MRTNIVLNDSLVGKAMRLSKISTKREVVTKALEEFVANRSRMDLRDIRGKVKFSAGYDYKALRQARQI